MFNQAFEIRDLVTIGFLILLEGVLSIDNALVLGLLARRVPKHQQRLALTYGLVGAFVFRFVAVLMASILLQWWLAKLIGGVYLIYISAKFFVSKATDKTEEKVVIGPDNEPALVDEATGKPLSEERYEEELQSRMPFPIPDWDNESEGPQPVVTGNSPGQQSRLAVPPSTGSTSPTMGPAETQTTQEGTAKFWPTVIVIELTDIAFAIDSILAAIAMVGSPPPGHVGLHPKLWVIVTGGVIGLALMRVAAVIFIKLLERFPRLEISAYLLVIVIGGKLCIDWGFNAPGQPAVIDFHHAGSLPFIIFWVLMVLCFLIGFIPVKNRKNEAKAA